MIDGQRKVEPIPVLRPSQVIAAELRHRILSGEWNEDVPVPPTADLAAQLGISRHHLREALRLLEHDGLVRVERGVNGGVILTCPGDEEITRMLEGVLARKRATFGDMHTARTVLDGAVAAMAAKVATDEDLADMESVLAREKAEGLRSDDQEICTDFHAAVLRATHNQPLQVVVGGAWTVGRVTGRNNREAIQAARSSPELKEGVLQAHSNLIEAIRAGDSERARSVMEQHHMDMWVHYTPGVSDLQIGLDG